MQLSEKNMIYKQRVRDGQMGTTPQILDDIPGSYGEAASILYCSAKEQLWWENVCVGGSSYSFTFPLTSTTMLDMATGMFIR